MDQSIPVISIDEMIEVDRIMIEDYGISLVQMMENAGKNLARLTQGLLGNTVINKNIVVLCGYGNNGGGGLVAARYLSNFGASVTAILTAEESELRFTPLQRWQTLNKLPVITIAGSFESIEPILAEAHMIIDAVSGYGFVGPPRGKPAEILEILAGFNYPDILSLDIPSALDGDTGAGGPLTVKASATMTLALPKTGLMKPTAAVYTGDIYLADIGVPPALYSKMGLSGTPAFSEADILKLA